MYNGSRRFGPRGRHARLSPQRRHLFGKIYSAKKDGPRPSLWGNKRGWTERRTSNRRPGAAINCESRRLSAGNHGEGRVRQRREFPVVGDNRARFRHSRPLTQAGIAGGLRPPTSGALSATSTPIFRHLGSSLSYGLSHGSGALALRNRSRRRDGIANFQQLVR